MRSTLFLIAAMTLRLVSEIYKLPNSQDVVFIAIWFVTFFAMDITELTKTKK